MVARTLGGSQAFTAGWVRLTPTRCAGVAPQAGAVALQALDAGADLVFTPGRPGGSTLGWLAAGPPRTPAGVQRFPLPPGATAAGEVVLAPWSGRGAPPRAGELRLIGP